MKGILESKNNRLTGLFHALLSCSLLLALAGNGVVNSAHAGQVGTTTGSFEVTAGGQAAYSMSIEVPPGIMGVVPQVAITYNSGGGNGLLGLGASLSGLSAITRCGKNIAQDDVSSAVQFNSSDYFCLNGQRLILMSGNYGANNSTYQTMVESFQKVTAKGSVADGPQYFEVLAKGGSKLVFGKSLDNSNHLERSIDPITGAVASWGISYLEDKHGNRVVYEYEDVSRTANGTTANQIVPKRITYGHNEAAGVTGKLAVEFVYETRPDTAKGYARGQQFVSDLRLSNIKTHVDTDVVRDYRVSYDQAPVGKQSRITQITECSGAGNCLLPVSFTWKDYSLGWVEGPRLPTAAQTSEGKIRGVSVDVNNDGHTDWVSAVRDASGNDDLKTYLNSNGTWTLTSDFVPPSAIFDYQRHADGVAVSELVDLNGDGLVDWVAAYEDASGTTNKVYLNTGSGWALDASRSLPITLLDVSNNALPKQRAQFIDLNGDARPDLVSSYRNANGDFYKNTWINIGSGWELSPDYKVPAIIVDYRLYSLGAMTSFFIDINNDGLKDLVRAYEDENGNWTRKTWLNTGTGWAVSTAFYFPAVIVDYSIAESPVGRASMVDINGDGLPDVVQAHTFANGSIAKKVWLNTGNGWLVDADLAPPTTVWDQVGTTLQTKGAFIDRNNDGLPDLVISYHKPSGTSAHTVWRNTGDGWVEDTSLRMSSYLMRIDVGKDSYARGLMIDANSDGRADMLWSLGGATSVVRFEGTNDEDFAHPEVITHFSDGLGNAYTPTYTPATYGDVYTAASGGQYPNLDAAGPMILISAVESSVGVDVTSRAEHQYFGKKINLEGRGDLGFAKKIAIDTRTNMRIETQFSQEWPYTGSPVSMKKITAGGTVLMESENRYTTFDVFGGKTFLIYQDLKTNLNRELDGQEIDHTTNETLTLDAYGNVKTTKTTRVFKANGANDTYVSTKTNTYTNDVSGWQIGRLVTAQSSVSAPNTPTVTQKTGFTYFPNGNLLTKVVEPGSSESVAETYAYDDFGHITSTTITAQGIEPRITTATYTADGRFAATATNPLSHTAASEYHPHFGQVTRTEGPNGSVTTKLYDEHGRMIKTSKIRTEADATNAEDQANNVIVFHPCSDENPCPTNAAYFLAAFDNEGESPETVYYDNRNREVRKQTQGFDGTSVYVDTLYDEFGRKASVTKPYYKDGDVHRTHYEYDLLGRVNKIITPAGKELNSTYYAGSTVVTNPAGQIKTTYVNGQGKPAKVVDHQGNELHYTYDAAGRLLTTTAGSDVSTRITIEYDAFGRKIRQDDPDLGEWEYRYDVIGQLTWQQDAKGQIVTMEYDNLGRITKRTENEGVTQWEYDFGNNALGKLSRVWNDTGYERIHQYDDYGRPIEVTTIIDGDSTTIKTDYHHTTDRVQYVEYPSGLKIRKEFNDYGFPLSIRSSSHNYLDRYEDAEAEAQTLAEAANTYKDATATARAGFLETYETEKEKGEAWELELQADQRRYHRALPGYNDHIDRQRESIEQAKHFERWGNSFREVAVEHQRYAIIHTHGAEIAANIIETKEPNWASMRYPDLGITEHDIISHMASLWGVTPTTLGHAFDSGRDKKEGAAWAEFLANEASRAADIAQNQMNEASARYEQLKVHVAAAEAHAGHAEVYYELHLQHISDRIDWRAGEIKKFYDLAIAAADEIEVIDTALKAKVDLAVNAQRQAEALLNYYQNEASELHWMAVSADAQGKVTNFTQGQHVSTEVTYEERTGRLHGVLSKSTPAPIELEAGQSAPSTTASLDDFVASVQATQAEAAGYANDSLGDLARTRAHIAALDPNDDKLSAAMQLAAQAQLDALRVNESVLSVDYDLNTDIGTLAISTLSGAANLSAQFDHLNEAGFANAEQHTNNVLVYNARVHALIASYHTQLKDLYEFASHQQTQKANDITDIDSVNPDFLQEYGDLGNYHTSIADQHQARADAVVIDDGSENANPELFGLAHASIRQKRLIDRHADISQKRRRLNVALFAPLQHLNEASRQQYQCTGDHVQALHFASNKLLGRADRERFKQLERLYRDRLEVLEVSATEDTDIFANDTERKALYQNLANINAELGDMYTNMASADYWSGMFASFADSLNGKSEVYNRLASNHHQIAANNELLASKSSELYDHQVLGSDDTILNDFYQWDDLGNLTERRHTVVDLVETFEYDELNRLTRSAIAGNSVELYELGGNDVVTYEYNELGNLTFKSDVGSYSYGQASGNAHAGPHAVTNIQGDTSKGHKNTNYAYDDNGNMTSGDGRTIEYTSFNKPKDVRGDGNPSQFVYGPERQMVKQVEQTGAVPKTTLYFGRYEKIYDGYQTTEKYHLSTHNGGVIAVIIDRENQAAPTTHYLHRDHLDSIVAISNEQGYVIERFFYDAFGKQLTAVTPDGFSLQSNVPTLYGNTLDRGLTDRGFTGHRTIQSGLVHMGGRVYDPAIGRFLSADPHIQFAGNLQNYNRYSYVNNNPLSFNDPTGYFISKIFKALKKLFKMVAKIIKKVMKVIKKVVKFIKENIKVIAAIVVAAVAVVVTGGAVLGIIKTAVLKGISGAIAAAKVGAVMGGLAGLIQTGSLSGALKGALNGAISGAKAGFIGGFVGIGPIDGGSYFGNGVRAGLSGGITNKLLGGSGSKGFRNAFVAYMAFNSGIGKKAVSAVQRGVKRVVRFVDNVINPYAGATDCATCIVTIEDPDQFGNYPSDSGNGQAEGGGSNILKPTVKPNDLTGSVFSGAAGVTSAAAAIRSGQLMESVDGKWTVPETGRTHHFNPKTGRIFQGNQNTSRRIDVVFRVQSHARVLAVGGNAVGGLGVLSSGIDLYNNRTFENLADFAINVGTLTGGYLRASFGLGYSVGGLLNDFTGRRASMWVTDGICGLSGNC